MFEEYSDFLYPQCDWNWANFFYNTYGFLIGELTSQISLESTGFIGIRSVDFLNSGHTFFILIAFSNICTLYF